MIPYFVGFIIFLSSFFHTRSNLALEIIALRQQVAWHRAGFRLFWRFRSRSKNSGRPRITAEIRSAIRRMTEENVSWGAPRIHGELLKLGFEVSERTVSRYLHRLSPSDQARKLWATFALKWKAKWFHRDQFLWQQNVADLSINESHKESSRQQIILLSLFDLRKAKGEILCDEILATDRIGLAK